MLCCASVSQGNIITHKVHLFIPVERKIQTVEVRVKCDSKCSG